MKRWGALGHQQAAHSALAALMHPPAGRLLLVRRRGGLLRTPAAAVPAPAAPAPAAPEGGAASDAPPRATPNEHRKQGYILRNFVIGYFVLSAVQYAFMGNFWMALGMLSGAAMTIAYFG